MMFKVLAMLSAIGGDMAGEPARAGGSAFDDLIVRVNGGYSCSPRKTCSKTIRSCEEAYWLLNNCSWGGALDRDNDGVPCENLCPGG